MNLADFKDVATVAIAFCVLVSGCVQVYIARQKLRLDLYDRRFAVYKSALEFQRALLNWRDFSSEDRRSTRVAFVRSVLESRFLFHERSGIRGLLEELNHRSFKVTGFIEYGHQLASSPPDFMKMYGDSHENLNWIDHSVEKLAILLVPYLAFTESREMFAEVE